MKFALLALALCASVASGQGFFSRKKKIKQSEPELEPENESALITPHDQMLADEFMGFLANNHIVVTSVSDETFELAFAQFKELKVLNDLTNQLNAADAHTAKCLEMAQDAMDRAAEIRKLLRPKQMAAIDLGKDPHKAIEGGEDAKEIVDVIPEAEFAALRAAKDQAEAQAAAAVAAKDKADADAAAAKAQADADLAAASSAAAAATAEAERQAKINKLFMRRAMEREAREAREAAEAPPAAVEEPAVVEVLVEEPALAVTMQPQWAPDLFDIIASPVYQRLLSNKNAGKPYELP